ncbi:MAG: hypothetical protein K6B70_05155 [Clostridia bacterium]|nr:hypothetical protein [Clostridia bacterium]
MKKVVLKVIIGIVAVPTVALGTLYVTRNIPVVNEKIVAPLANVANSIGLPVLVKPKISEETMRDWIANLKYIYNSKNIVCEGEYPNYETDTIDEWLEKIGCRNPETQELQNVKVVNTQEGFGTKYFILLYSEKEGYNLTWREFLEIDLRVTKLRKGASEDDIQKCLQLDLEEDIPMKDQAVVPNLNEFEEKYNQLVKKEQELCDEYTKTYDKDLLKQINEIQLEETEVMLQKYTKEYELVVKEGDTSNIEALKGYIRMYEEMKKEKEEQLRNFK